MCPPCASCGHCSRSLRDAGHCILFSSHVMQEVAQLCDEVIVIAPAAWSPPARQRQLRARTGAANFEDAFVALTGDAESDCEHVAGRVPQGIRGEPARPAHGADGAAVRAAVRAAVLFSDAAVLAGSLAPRNRTGRADRGGASGAGTEPARLPASQARRDACARRRGVRGARGHRHAPRARGAGNHPAVRRTPRIGSPGGVAALCRQFAQRRRTVRATHRGVAGACTASRSRRNG